ncbi:MAG: SH3 domain-containing protein [Pyrinomonadaceae bacterium]
MFKRTVVINLIWLAILMFGAVSFVPAQTENSCDTWAYIIDDDPNGLNVRAGAGSNFKVSDTIPKDADGTSVNIVGSKGKWLKIKLAENSEGENVFSGSGWIYGPLVALRTRGSGASENELVKLYDGAKTSGRVVGRLKMETEVTLLGCKAAWVEVAFPGKSDKTGWLPPESQCGNPVTTCP